MNILRLSPSHQEKSGITDYSYVFDKILKQEGVEIIKAKDLFTSRSTWWLPFDFVFRSKFWENLLNNVNAIHAEIGMHQAKEILTLYYLVRKRKDLKIFITVHDPGVDSYRIFKIHYNTSGSFFSKVVSKIADKVEPMIDRLIFNRVTDYIFEQSSVLFVFSQWGAKQLSIKYPKVQEKITIINFPIYDFPKQKIKQKLNRNIVFAGFWSRNKGIETLIHAYNFLIRKQKTGTPRLILAGETQMPNSSYSRQIKKLVEVLGLKNYVDFPGFLKEDKLFELLSKAFLIIPYTNKISGSVSGIYIRGLQAGAVTIVANNPSLLSFAREKSISLIFKEGMVEDLSDKISQVIQNPKLAYRLAQEGQEFVYKYGNWKRVGRSIIEIYERKLLFDV